MLAPLCSPVRARSRVGPRRWLRSAAGLLAFALALGAAGPARAGAGPNDADVEALIDGVFAADYAKGRYQDALDKLEMAKIACQGGGCSAPVHAKVYMAVGSVYAGGLHDSDKAEAAFKEGLRRDAEAGPLAEHTSPDIRASFMRAKQDARRPAGRGCRAEFSGGRRPAPAGWRKAEAAFCYERAAKAQEQADLRGCLRDARASLEIEPRVSTRALLARCLRDDNQWIQALAELEQVVATAPRAGLPRLARQAKDEIAELRQRIPALVIESPAEAGELSDLAVELDGQAIEPGKLDSEIRVNPGTHEIAARARRRKAELVFQKKLVVEPEETFSVTLKLQPIKKEQPEAQCEPGEEGEHCEKKEPVQARELTGSATTGVSVYHDSNHVDLVRPRAAGRIEDTTGGWGLGASFDVDVITAASVDVVSTASPRWREARLAPALDGHKRLGEVDLQLHGALSTEPDYLTGAAGAKVAVDLRGRTVTPSLGYEFTHDTIGRAETTFATFSREVSRHALEVGLGLVLGRATYGSLGLRGVLELGDSSNPYRHVPVFHESIADLIQPGLSVDEVNYFRLPMRPLEQLPDGRGRLSVAAALAQRFGPSTLRLGERLYFDSWGVMATTSTGSFTYGVTKWLGLGPELGFHGQQGASFYRMVYPARESDEGFAMPRYRTSDRELGPLYTLSVGALARLGFGEPTRWGASLSGDVAYSKFLRHLFLVDRIAYLGALNLEVAFE